MKNQIKIRHFPFKRAFDMIFSMLALLITLPVLILIALTVSWSSGWQVFYSHKRMGRGGVVFECYKFRTMYSDAEMRLQEILKNDHKKRLEWETYHKLKDDPRVTPFGAFLRRSSLDELPQFWNILKGDLSVVGPRPVVFEELVKHYGPKAQKILSIRPGLTGIWQVSGRSNTSYHDRVFLDEKYVDTHSFLLDLKLIAKTIPMMIHSKGAY